MRQVALGVAAVAIALTAGAVGWTLTNARSDLMDGAAALGDAESAVDERDMQRANAALSRAHTAFARGHGRLASSWALPARVVPVVGANVDAATEMARVGAVAASAGAELTGELAELDAGIEAFAPHDGRIPVAAIDDLAAPLRHAADRLATAITRAEHIGAGGLVGQVRAARDELVARLGDAHETVEAAAALTEALPAFLGRDGPRRYLVGAQNPAELRGTGGLIGAIGELTVDDGAIEISEFRSVGELTRNAPDELPAPSADFAARYGRYGATTHGSNINMTPDVPTAATALERLYAAVEPEPVDGTILADPRLFQALLEVTGPVAVDEVGEIAADEVITFATRTQYEELDDAPDRKELLGDLAAEALRGFLDGAGDPREAVTTLGEAVGDGRLALHAADEDVQAAFAAAGLDGGMAAPDGDYLAVVGNNAAGHKADTFYDRELTYTVRLRPDGSATATLRMELINRAPTDGYHRTVLGHRLDAPGDNRTIWSVYCGRRCEPTAFRRDGEPGPLVVERELERPVATATTLLASGESTVLEWDWAVADAWRPHADGERGRYELTIDGQPHLMDDQLAVRVHPPADHRLAAVPGSPLETPVDGAARFDREPTDRVTLAARVELAPGPRLVERAREAINRPLLSLLTE